MLEYRTEVCVREISVQRMLERYYTPAALEDSCRGCPFYGSVWSCPPDLPETPAFFAPFRRVFLIGVKVIYTPDCRRFAPQSTAPEPAQQRTYGSVKKALLETQLMLERQFPGTTAIAAGRCEQCERCTRASGAPCIRPARMRYSFSAFRFDLTRIARDELHMPLQWSTNGLPPYQVAIAALLAP